MITVSQILDMFEVFESIGLQPPDIYSRPATPKAPSGRAFAASVYVAAFNQGGYTWPEVQAAAIEYANEPQEGQYRKPWPTPGHIAARTAMGRLAVTLGTDADADRAWIDMVKRLKYLACYQRQPAGPFDLPTALDQCERRHAAMWAGLVVIGGVRGWGASEEGDRAVLARFRTAYIAERQRQRMDPVAVRGILTTANRLMIEGK